jgi:hypothetical protein
MNNGPLIKNEARIKAVQKLIDSLALFGLDFGQLVDVVTADVILAQDLGMVKVIPFAPSSVVFLTEFGLKHATKNNQTLTR